MTEKMGLKQKISNLPQKPGVYQFLDKTGRVLYIGKAKNLRARVKQYFGTSDERPQIPYLMKEVAKLDYTIVNTELESLYLERTLIQKHTPKYNIELRDDKNYAFIAIDYSTQIPQITIQRKIQEPITKNQTNSKSKIAKTTSYKLPATSYFGPYTSAKKIRDLIFTARKTFGICSAKKIGIPCFYFHLHRCPGVCSGVISLSDYHLHLNKIKQLFSGKITKAEKNIKTEMAKAAKQKKFEKAARLRDQFRSLEILGQKQNMILTNKAAWDVIGAASNDKFSCVNLFKIREGKLLGKENFIYELKWHKFRSRGIYAKDVIQKFLEEYYLTTSEIPKTVYIESAAGDKKIVQTLLQKRAKKKVKLIVPQKGKAKKLALLSKTNADEYLKNYLNAIAGHQDKIQKGLLGLKKVLKLKAIPKRIEGYDISNIQGTNAVGSMVVFEDGKPAKSHYRKFKIRDKQTPDDFAMMQEMLSRRFTHSVNLRKFQNSNNKLQIKSKSQNPKEQWPTPDLIVIDGGRGQLNAAIKVLTANRYSPNAIPIIGLAKRLEEIFIPGQETSLILGKDDPTLHILQNLRDEAHRFGITFHKKLRSKQAIKSVLDEIPGIGPKTKKLLKQKFGGVANIKKTDFDDLKNIIGESKAKIIKGAM
ncbi:MAG: hypothetical protein COT92_03315 [Candidatus Doudnabacteria bacterium CG10_big_fil_rev_8_21_14_0_10_42_18]|uniref:UvrABC system protein C n=1 Tax=Candidatus Doudnabacteria bacterium CG10_big_fil_rev_8_21_14_0_10_42_18 TaxID=1974552 RepID=A0A2H0VAB4_9BACT|nr:MAG: hypothetical protein COT92_03315 [Candidatus Doudnabacteria bacterium CG10_big_fil_rev_8_21_14_0_10_42_18]